jgi:toxin-antitoxin system PIN domain toxin
MKHLLDVNLLLAAIWSNHSNHAEAFAWIEGKSIVVCPLSELGFIRISTNKKAINAPMDKARELLELFIRERGAERIPDDVPALESHPETSDQVTDHYLADLAANHSMKLATLDTGITHAAVVTVHQKP